MARAYYRNQVSEIDMNSRLRGQVDIPRLREGKVGGFAHSVYIMCPVSAEPPNGEIGSLTISSTRKEDAGYPLDNEGNFTTPTHRVRDSLEQIDVAKLLIEKYSDVSCSSSAPISSPAHFHDCRPLSSL